MRPLSWTLVIVGLSLALWVAGKPRAAPIAQANSDGTVITLTDEPCAISAVENLPLRATWTQNGKTFEGCWAAHPAGIVLLYFDDRSVTIAPRSVFQKLTGV